MSLRRQLQKRSGLVVALLHDGGLLQALRSELDHELSSSPPPNRSQFQVERSVGDFTVEWDDPRTQDVVLRRWHGGPKGEEIAVSALLAPLRFQGDAPLPRHALLKVCVRKPDADPILRFDCSVFRRGGDGSGSDFAVRRTCYYPSLTSWRAVKYRGPKFSSLDPQLRGSLKEYLVDRGIGMELNDFLLQHLHKKEQSQYINWLQTLERLVAKDA